MGDRARLVKVMKELYLREPDWLTRDEKTAAVHPGFGRPVETIMPRLADSDLELARPEPELLQE